MFKFKPAASYRVVVRRHPGETTGLTVDVTTPRFGCNPDDFMAEALGSLVVSLYDIFGSTSRNKYKGYVEVIEVNSGVNVKLVVTVTPSWKGRPKIDVEHYRSPEQLL